MPIDVARVLAAKLGADAFRYTDSQVMLYGLSIGFGADPTDNAQLRFCIERDLAVFPTFGVLPAAGGLTEFLSLPGLDINPVMLVHGEHTLTVHRYPIPVSGTLSNTGRVEAIYDKGDKGAVAVVRSESVGEDGTPYFTNRASVFMRGEGNFGGEPGPQVRRDPPARDPDHVALIPTLPQQALLYRLHVEADRNPIHAWPDMAAYAGFPRPILHGLCTFGIVARAIVQSVCGGDETRFIELSVRFVGPLFPGETVRTLIWDEGEGDLTLKAQAAERDADVIANARARITV